MTLNGAFPFLLTLGKVLSAVALLLLLAAMVDVWRRKSFPGVSYGGITLSSKRLRWVWLLVLVGAFGVGVNEDPMVVSSTSMEDPEATEAASSFTSVGLNLPLPFYRYDRQRIYGDGELVNEQVSEGLLIPWPLISALLAYLVLVLRWNPQSHRARRILQGRRWEAEEPSEGQGTTPD